MNNIEKKVLKKSCNNEDKTLQALVQYCSCKNCSGCGSVPSSDYTNVKNSALINNAFR